ncbi:hypothetical protein [Desulfovibrio porci]|uniref:hypothetical protein n=1 Tax=Desulfovibrio porci TaxID=2605782 RepID=UPI003A8ECDD5
MISSIFLDRRLSLVMAQQAELRELAMHARLSDNAGYAVQALALRQAELADEITCLADMSTRGKRRGNRQEVAA